MCHSTGNSMFNFMIISSWKRAVSFKWTHLNILQQRMLCAKFAWYWSSGSGEEDENVKQRQRTTDKFLSEKLTWAFGSGELKTVQLNCCQCACPWFYNFNINHHKIFITDYIIYWYVKICWSYIKVWFSQWELSAHTCKIGNIVIYLFFKFER